MSEIHKDIGRFGLVVAGVGGLGVILSGVALIAERFGLLATFFGLLVFGLALVVTASHMDQ